MFIPKVEQVSKSNLARRATLTFNGKLITLPSYGCTIKREYELNLLCEQEILKKEHLGFIASKIQLIADLTRLKEANRHQKALFEDAPADKAYEELKKKIWFVDTCSEELYYSPFVRDEDLLKNGAFFSPKMKKFLAGFDKDSHNKKWLEIKNNEALMMQFIREYLAPQTEAKLDFVSPIVPVLFSESPKYMIDIWYEIIKTTGVLAKLREKPSSINMVLHYNNFKKTNNLTLLLGKLFNEEAENELSDYRVVLLKVIDAPKLHEETAETRLKYREFIKALTNYCSNTGRALIMVDADSIGLFSISLGVDSFVEPLNGILGTGFGKSQDKHGRYYHPEGLKFITYDDAYNFVQTSGHLPCHCSFCNQVNRDTIDNIDTQAWNYFRRGHLVSARNEELKETHEAIRLNTISNAITDKVQRSDLKNYLDILPKT